MNGYCDRCPNLTQNPDDAFCKECNQFSVHQTTDISIPLPTSSVAGNFYDVEEVEILVPIKVKRYKNLHDILVSFIPPTRDEVESALKLNINI